MCSIPVLQVACRSSVFLHGFRFAHCRKDGLEFFVKHLAAALYGMCAVDVNGSKTVFHAHTGSRVAVDCRFHGDVVFRELVAGLGVVAVCVQRFQIHLNTELLKLRLDKLRVTDMSFLACIAGKRKGADLAVRVHIEAVCVLFCVTGVRHILRGFVQILTERLSLLITHGHRWHEAAVGVRGIDAAEYGAEAVIVQRVGDCQPEVLIRKRPICVVERQHRRCIRRRDGFERQRVGRSQHILIRTGNTRGVCPRHVQIAVLEREIHGIFVAKQPVGELADVRCLRIIWIRNEGERPSLLVEAVEHIRSAGDAGFSFCDGILALVDVLRHDAEGRHVGKLTHVGRRERQGDGHSIVGNRIGCVFCFCGLTVRVCLRDKVGAAVCVVILKGKQDVRRRNRFAIRPRHARLDGVDPGNGIFCFVGSQQRMVIALRVLPDERKLAHTAGKHIEVILTKRRCLNGSRRADRELLDGIGGRVLFCRFFGLHRSLFFCGRFGRSLLRHICRCFGFAARCQSKYKTQAEQQSKKFFHCCSPLR